MLSNRPSMLSDLKTLCSFPQNMDELYFFFPKASFPLTIDQLENVISQREHSTSVEYNGLLAGFANFYSWEKHGTCKVGNVIVNPVLRNKGVAQYLMSTMQQKAKKYYQAKTVQVSCFNHNTAGLLLYKKMGFNIFDIEERFDKNDKKVALMHFKINL